MFSIPRHLRPSRQAALRAFGRTHQSKSSSIRPFTSNVAAAIDQRADQVKRELAVLAQAFERYDGDGKGALNTQSLQKALQDLDLPSGEVEVKELFKALDENDVGKWK